MPEQIETKMLSIPVSDAAEVPAYLARPLSEGRHPSIIVIQEVFGLNADIKDIAERYARLGFAAIAPDLYHGKVYETIEDARNRGTVGADPALIDREIDLCAAWLTSQSFGSGGEFGCVGFCMGGGLSLRTASRNPHVAACVSYYGGVRENIDETVGKIKAPVLGFHGTDELERGNQLKEAFAKHGKNLELHFYEGAKHGFFNNRNGGVYNHAASYDSWPRAIEFFKKHLS
ncbi:MAG: dienelactone hydrolase family protein [Dehalococcoidia bacterium]|nr:dienelactone hydrolase family protein [Dehalococcoidia bacterium]